MKFLEREARQARLISYKQKAAWLRGKVREAKADPEKLEALRELLRGTVLLPLEPSTVDYINDRLKKEEAFARHFASVKPALSIAEAKRLKLFPPIKWYFEKIIGVRFKSNHAFCPKHGGDSGQSFSIAEGKWQTFTCWSCGWRGDLLDAHQYFFKFPHMRAAIESLIDLGSNPESVKSFLAKNQVQGPIILSSPFLPPGIVTQCNNSKPAKATRPAARAAKEPVPPADPGLLARWRHVDAGFLREASPVGDPQARDFAKVLLALTAKSPHEGKLRILRPASLPVVFTNINWAIVGPEAGRLLRGWPDQLQYVCQCTAKSPYDNNNLTNLRERLFLDVEFDHFTLADQLPLLWHLKKDLGWRLISITHSGGKSYHGLFFVRGLGRIAHEVDPMREEGPIIEMRRIAAALGADAKTMRPSQGVRMPGGFNRKHKVRQEILFLNPQAILPVLKRRSDPKVSGLALPAANAKLVP